MWSGAWKAARARHDAARPERQLARAVGTHVVMPGRTFGAEGAFVAADIRDTVGLQRLAASFALPSHLEPEKLLKHPVEVGQLWFELEPPARRQADQSCRTQAHQVLVNGRFLERQLV